MKRNIVSFGAFFLLCFLAFSTRAAIHEFAEILASDGSRSDVFGGAVAISGDVILVGTTDDDDFKANSGAVYVFTKNSVSDVWQQTQKLAASTATTSTGFGNAVAISGDVAFVAEVHTSSYIFTRNSDDNWEESEKLKLTTPREKNYINDLAIEDDTAVLGAYLGDGSATTSGVVYVYTKDADGNWSKTATLQAESGESGDMFGYAVAILDDRIVVGAPKAFTFGGAVYVFEKNSDGEWKEVDTLTDSSSGSAANFGNSVDIATDVIVVGAEYDDDNGTNAGAAYVFSKSSDGTWEETTKLLASDGTAGDNFGNSTAISQDTIVIGAILDDEIATQAGSAYVFKKNSEGNWEEASKLTASEGSSGDRFGIDAEIDDGNVIIGAALDDDTSLNAGSAYIFEKDWDSDGYNTYDVDGSPTDCDDTNPYISPNPAVEEIYDEVDNDCDGSIDELTEFFDDDGDGYAESAGDCDDADAALSPAATEICGDSLDNDCDGSTDEGCAPPARFFGTKPVTAPDVLKVFK